VSPSALKERFHEFDDKQRIDRLSACHDLDRILNNCRERHPQQQQHQDSPQSQSRSDSDHHHGHDPIESVSIGLRNMKYFGWRGILSSTKKNETVSIDNDSNADDNGNDDPDLLSVFHSKIRSSCAREQHAVWACRAVSTGCGNDLAELKRCFEDIDDDNQKESNNNNNNNHLPQHIRVLTAPYTNYEGIVEKFDVDAKADGDGDATASLKQRIPCHEVQRRLGLCVTANGKQLLERKQQRERQQQQQR